MSKHTPRPWDNKQVDIWGADRVGLRLGFLNTSNEQSRKEGLANARLIAAAPELLDALTRMLKQFPADSDLYAAGWDSSAINEACDAYDAARAAVRKATGEE